MSLLRKAIRAAYWRSPRDNLARLRHYAGRRPAVAPVPIPPVAPDPPPVVPDENQIVPDMLVEPVYARWVAARWPARDQPVVILGLTDVTAILAGALGMLPW